MQDKKEMEVLCLSILERKPTEDYFEGLKKRKIKRRTKPIKQKRVIPVETKSSSALNADWISVLTEGRLTDRKCNVLEETLEKRRVQLKIQAQKAMRKHEEEKSLLKQRLAEQNYLQEQENLAESWLKALRQREEGFYPSRRCTCPRLGSPLPSRKFPRDGVEMAFPRGGRGVGERVEKPAGSVDDLAVELSSSLVFVDVEESD